ncbi:Gypsy retrotransposon integrase-like protein 1 [Gossypium australe]|uniref:Gypsy retrotransposon integrase-like protein 1 n=1 Tax=Gossypium australe TaxID=47621 RepID=A0A5B6W8N7_9ROSI|nr:Gypsy retrotransposon integrase-like protein 1 [Gossypium australe]
MLQAEQDNRDEKELAKLQRKAMRVSYIEKGFHIDYCDTYHHLKRNTLYCSYRKSLDKGTTSLQYRKMPITKCQSPTKSSGALSSHVRSLVICNLGVDILGMFPTATTQKKFIIVAVDYFTKWIVVEVLQLSQKSRWSHFFGNQFGIPHKIITDNNTQFQGKFKKSCTNLQIALAQSLVKMP